jgi:hypothetical protein
VAVTDSERGGSKSSSRGVPIHVQRDEAGTAKCIGVLCVCVCVGGGGGSSGGIL